jgi:hypothetical protein
VIGFLETLVSVFVNLGAWIVYGIETVINVISYLFEETVLAAIALLPGLPSVFTPPTFLGWLNWFYPVGAVMSVATSLLAAYVTFLAIRWILKKAGVL